VPSGGIAPLFVQWFIGTGCVAANAITPPPPTSTLTYVTGVLSTTTVYSAQVTDSSGGTPAASACATITITVNNGPISVAADSVGSYAGLVYVTNPTSIGSGSLADSVSVIDSDSNSVVAVVPLTYTVGATTYTVNPWGVAIDPVNNLVYVTGTYGTGFNTATPTYVGGVVCVISQATNTETGCQVTSGMFPEGVAVNTALGQAFVANSDNDHVDIFNTPIIAAAVNSVLVGPGPMNVVVNQATYNVFVSDNGGNTISVLQPRGGTNYAVTTVTVGFEPVGIAINPLNNNVYVANSGSGTVSVLSGTTFQTLATIKTGGSPTGIDIDTVSNTAYVADAANGDVIAINLATNAPSATTIPVGSTPMSVSFFLNPASPALPNLVYVANSGSNFVSVINPATGLVVATIVVP